MKHKKLFILSVFLFLTFLSGVAGTLVITNSRYGGVAFMINEEFYLSLVFFCLGGVVGAIAVLGEKKVGACVLVGILALPLTAATITAFTTTPCSFLSSHTTSELATNLVVAWKKVNVTANQWLLTQTAYVWTEQNIIYASDEEVYGSSEHWASPDEVLMNRRGDCEDRAIFLCALLEKFGINAYAACVVEPRGHVFVIIPQGLNLTILDYGEEYSTGNENAVAFEPESRLAEPELNRYFSLPNVEGGRISLAFNSKEAVPFKDDAELLAWINSFEPIPGTLPTPFKPDNCGPIFENGTVYLPAMEELGRWNAFWNSIATPEVEVKKSLSPLWFSFGLLVLVGCELEFGLYWKNHRKIKVWHYNKRRIKSIVWDLDNFAVFWLYVKHEHLNNATVRLLDDINTRKDVTEEEWRKVVEKVRGKQ